MPSVRDYQGAGLEFELPMGPVPELVLLCHIRHRRIKGERKKEHIMKKKKKRKMRRRLQGGMERETEMGGKEGVSGDGITCLLAHSLRKREGSEFPWRKLFPAI